MCTVSTLGRDSYHHGDLRAALLTQALAMLGQSPTFSLRALAKKTGVTPTAVYRHFADKQALESALAAQGYEELLLRMKSESESHVHSRGDVWRLAYAYITWASDNEPLFSLMFTTHCDPNAPERVAAVNSLKAFLAQQVQLWYPGYDNDMFLTVMWGFVHGTATLYLQGKILADQDATGGIEETVRSLWETFTSTVGNGS